LTTTSGEPGGGDLGWDFNESVLRAEAFFVFFVPLLSRRNPTDVFFFYRVSFFLPAATAFSEGRQNNRARSRAARFFTHTPGSF
jgi:hypothetical protein